MGVPVEDDAGTVAGVLLHGGNAPPIVGEFVGTFHAGRGALPDFVLQLHAARKGVGGDADATGEKMGKAVGQKWERSRKEVGKKWERSGSVDMC